MDTLIELIGLSHLKQSFLPGICSEALTYSWLTGGAETRRSVKREYSG